MSDAGVCSAVFGVRNHTISCGLTFVECNVAGGCRAAGGEKYKLE